MCMMMISESSRILLLYTRRIPENIHVNVHWKDILMKYVCEM